MLTLNSSIRMTDVTVRNHNKTDQFRVMMTQVQDASSTMFANAQQSGSVNSGVRDVAATLYATRQSGADSRESHFESLLGSGHSSKLTQYRMLSDDHGQEGDDTPSSGIKGFGSKRLGSGGPSTPNPVIILTAICCVIALMLPVNVSEDGEPSILPSYLHLSVPQKLIAAYALGLVTMVIFKPWSKLTLKCDIVWGGKAAKVAYFCTNYR